MTVNGGTNQIITYHMSVSKLQLVINIRKQCGYLNASNMMGLQSSITDCISQGQWVTSKRFFACN